MNAGPELSGADFHLLLNPGWSPGRRWDRRPGALSVSACGRAAEAIRAWPGYAPSPLADLRELAREAGVASIAYLDEGGRFGVGSFKALGAPYALARMLAARLGRMDGRRVATREIIAGEHRGVCRAFTAAAATDGNHGRALAWAARAAGCGCVIYVPPSVSPGRVQVIRDFGARITQVDGTYDDAVARCTEECQRNGWLEVTDTAASSRAGSPGLSAVRSVIAGYGLMIDEALDRLPAPPTHLFAQGGVGGFAAGAASRLWQRLGDNRVRVVVVEPHRAACLFASARTGAPTPAAGDLNTLMQGLACGEVSVPAWELLAEAACAFLSIGDRHAVLAMRRLAHGAGADPDLIAGETGAAGAAGLLAVAGNPDARAALALDGGSRVLLVGTEGATDPVRYEQLVGHPPGAPARQFMPVPAQ